MLVFWCYYSQKIFFYICCKLHKTALLLLLKITDHLLQLSICLLSLNLYILYYIIMLPEVIIFLNIKNFLYYFLLFRFAGIKYFNFCLSEALKSLF